jgi:hypothetical protein
VYWLACLVAMTTAVLLGRLLLVQVRKLLEEVAGVVHTWRAVRRDLALHPGSTGWRARRPSRKSTPRNAELRASPLLRVPNSRETPTAPHPPDRSVTPQRIDGPRCEQRGPSMSCPVRHWRRIRDSNS